MSHRQKFIVPQGAYLMAHAMGCLTRAGRQQAEAMLAQWASDGALATHSHWLGRLDAFRAAVAKLLNAKAADICPQTNVTSGLSKLLFSLPKRKGRTRIVLSEDDFPSLGFALSAAESLGYSLVWRKAGAPWDKVLDEHAQLALITHSTFGASRLAGVAAITNAAAKLGVYTAVDVAQSAGVVPIDIKAWRADFVLGTSVKWLCGATGACFIWVRPELIQKLEPLDLGWFSHEAPMEFDIRNFRLAKDARRFWGGTPSFMPFSIAAAGIETILEIGVQQVRAWNLELTRRIMNDLKEAGVKIVSPDKDSERGGTVVADFGDNERAVQAFAAAGVRCDQRKGYGVRLSPHIYTQEAELELLRQKLPALR